MKTKEPLEYFTPNSIQQYYEVIIKILVHLGRPSTELGYVSKLYKAATNHQDRYDKIEEEIKEESKTHICGRDDEPSIYHDGQIEAFNKALEIVKKVLLEE